MRVEWLEDLIAIIDCGTLTRAAEARFLTQPAFSRRIRTIEDHVGADLIEHGTRPARLKPAVLRQEERLRELVESMRRLMRDLRNVDGNHCRVIVAGPHSIITSISPYLLHSCLQNTIVLNLNGADRDQCFAQLITRQADLVLAFQTSFDKFNIRGDFLEERSLGLDPFIPVFATDRLPLLESARSKLSIPVVLYPREVFLGRHMEREILPTLFHSFSIMEMASTALTVAALHLAMAGVGVAWVPGSLAARELALGTIIDLSDWLPSSDLRLSAFRLSQVENRSKAEDTIWTTLNGSVANLKF